MCTNKITVQFAEDYAEVREALGAYKARMQMMEQIFCIALMRNIAEKDIERPDRNIELEQLLSEETMTFDELKTILDITISPAVKGRIGEHNLRIKEQKNE